MRWSDRILALGLLPWFVLMDTRRFHTWLVAQAVRDYVSRPRATKFPRTDLERWVAFIDLFSGCIDQAVWMEFK